eukprot:TRINITY_DN50_c0_g1_i4.p1 TRINITY_DN50_c0_g1~~TRINITY_DN50_c0_g1_i4.p1  ORF type:complete len:556 (+),score=76.37 TRINITY_DN50_c0_g1_i4:55-1722(+)
MASADGPGGLDCDAGEGFTVFVSSELWECPYPFDIPAMCTVGHLAQQVARAAGTDAVRLFMGGDRLDYGAILADLGVCPQTVLTAATGFDEDLLATAIKPGQPEQTVRAAVDDHSAWLTRMLMEPMPMNLQDLRLDPRIPENTQKVKSAMHIIRQALSGDASASVGGIIEAGTVPLILSALQADVDAELQFEASWCLTNLCCGESAHCVHVVEAGAVPLLVPLLKSPHEAVVSQAAWALANIASDCVRLRDTVLAEGALEAALAASRQEWQAGVLNNLVWFVSSLARGCPKPPESIMRTVLAFSLEHVRSPHAGLRLEGLQGLAAAADSDDGCSLLIEEMRKVGIRVMDLANWKDDDDEDDEDDDAPRVQVPLSTLQVMEAFCSRGHEQLVIDSWLLDAVAEHARRRCNSELVRRAAFKVLGALAAGASGSCVMRITDVCSAIRSGLLDDAVFGEASALFRKLAKDHPQCHGEFVHGGVMRAARAVLKKSSGKPPAAMLPAAEAFVLVTESLAEDRLRWAARCSGGQAAEDQSTSDLLLRLKKFIEAHGGDAATP